MAATKFTAQLGKRDLKDVIIANGTAEAQSETISVNIDYTNISKGEALLLLEAIEAKIYASPWPPQ